MPKLRRLTNKQPKAKVQKQNPSKISKIVNGPELPTVCVGGVLTALVVYLATLPISDLTSPIMWFCMGISVHGIARALGSWVSARMRASRQWRNARSSRILRSIARAFAP